MIYPKWLKDGDYIGIMAPSNSITKDKVVELELACKHFKEQGYNVIETESVRSGNDPSASPEVRSMEWAKMVHDDRVKLISLARGGDFLYDMLPYANITDLLEHPKWVQGYSDPTGLLYGITTKLDIATIYGGNTTTFAMHTLHDSLKENFALWKGQLNCQHSFKMYEGKRSDSMDGYALTDPVEWKTPNGPVNQTGRLLGGCMESLLDLLGTPFEDTLGFIKKYENDGIIWYFDIFSLPAESVYRGLLHMKMCGWFETAKAFIFGRVVFPSTFVDMTYEEAVIGALGKEIPVIMEADVGHVNPRMTFVNGCVANVLAKEGKGTISYDFI